MRLSVRLRGKQSSPRHAPIIAGRGHTLPKQLQFSTEFQLEPLSPYDFTETVHKPAGWAFLTPQEVFEKDAVWTAARFEYDKLLGVKLKSKGTINEPRIKCTIFSDEPFSVSEKEHLEETAGWMLNAREDLTGFYALARKDAFVKALIEDLYGVHDTLRPDLFPLLTLAVTLQMAPIARSDQMMNLLIAEYGEKIAFDGKTVGYWPSPETIAKARLNQLRERCKLGYRARALKRIAQTLLKGFPSMGELANLPEEQSKAKLRELYGIGEYSVDIVTPHTGFPVDVWSAKIFSLLLFGQNPESPRDAIPELRRVAEERWGEWRGHVFVYVLNDLENLSRRYGLDLTDI